MTTKKIDILFDDGGGILMQVSGRKFVHHYDDGKQAAHNLVAILCGSNVADWDGACLMYTEYRNKSAFPLLTLFVQTAMMWLWKTQRFSRRSARQSRNTT